MQKLDLCIDVCRLLHMKTKKADEPIYKPENPKYLVLKEMAAALEYGSVKSDRRVQLVMPNSVVEELDASFPEQNRSHLLTKLALDALLTRKRFADDPEMESLVLTSNAASLDLLEYLEEREGSDQ